ncbi:AMP-binding protein [Actinacidiphila oryziradicis]|nr:AMP-binding protein [Actinacidiphila oryziradicis]
MSILGWLSAPTPGRGVWLAGERDGWERVEYAVLAADARAVAADLAARGVGRGDVVAIALPGSRDGLAALYGAWAAGACATMLPVPGYGAGAEYTAHTAAILEQARPAVTFADAESAPLLEGVAQVSEVRRDGVGVETLVEPGGVAVLQFTSGTTRSPRAIQVTWDNIVSNFGVLYRWMEWKDGDGMASWLPFNHDMGLLACVMTAARQGDLWLMRPDQFIRGPERWLSCLGPGKASHAGSPSFGFGYVARRVRPEQWAELDLSGWRSAIVGGEVPDPGALRAFAAAAAPAGFDPAGIHPAYGLAENTSAVTAGAVGRPGRVVRPDWERMQFGEPVHVVETGLLLPPADAVTSEAGDGAGWLAGQGWPIPVDEVEVRIADGEGKPLPEGSLGEIVITGRSVAVGYVGDEPFDGLLHTGDAGFVHDGDLYVLGRMGDSLKVRARTVYVEDLEFKAREAAGLNRLAVVSMSDRGRPGIAVFAEAEPGPWADKVNQALRTELGPDPEIAVIAGEHGLICRTSSGKPQRRVMWQLWSAGKLPGTRLS